jgi:hypothetical protein
MYIYISTALFHLYYSSSPNLSTAFLRLYLQFFTAYIYNSCSPDLQRFFASSFSLLRLHFQLFFASIKQILFGEEDL